MDRFSTIINDAISLDTLEGASLTDKHNQIVNTDIPELINLIESSQTNKHFAIIKFLNFYLELLKKVDKLDNDDMESFIELNIVINDFITKIRPEILNMKELENENFDQLNRSINDTINLTHLGGSKYDYRQKYLKYKTKYLNLKNA
jgi:hypothetical protein